MKKLFYLSTLVLLLGSSLLTYAQKVQSFNLSQLLKSGKLVTNEPDSISSLSDGKYHGVACKTGIYWIKGLNFSNGTIEADIKGRDVLQQSFLGIAFHGLDTANFDVIYLRPFNFQSTDTLRKKHAVQYVSAPDYPWERTRKEHPLEYEQPITPSSISPADWVHVSIVVQGESISVFLNHSTVPTLKVKKLDTRSDGLLGLWAFGNEEADFANLVITAKS